MGQIIGGKAFVSRKRAAASGTPDGPSSEFPLKTQLAELLVGRVLWVGVGNRMRGDDAAGPLLIDLIAKVNTQTCLDCGVAPENYLGKIEQAHAETILFVDAMDFGGHPGGVRVFTNDDLASGALNTHGLSLATVCEYLKASAPVRIFILGIQPVSLGLGDPVSPQVADAVKGIADALTGLLSHA